ncbi:MAG: D-glucuronyl C5-epimerase family protein [Thermofilaceae archaeon]
MPWVSGMAQGLAISVMLRAFVSTKNSMFLEYAEQFANVMLSDIESGGALYVDSRGVWIEEYPAEFPPKHVLNGLIFSIIGLYELTLFNRKYSKILSKIILTIEKNISLYDLGFWSKYDIEHCADLKYHLLNTILIYLLSDIFKSERLAQVAKRWLNGYYIFGKTKKLLQSR